MRRLFFSFLAFMASVTTLMADCPPSTATATVTLTRRTGQFTVNGSGGKVTFSPGNLQYRASSNTWRFAPTQYHIVGNAVGNTAPSSTQSGWIDLFGWATSGNSASGTAYQPYSTSTTDTDYGPNISSGEWTASNSDWGVVNAAQLGSGWRTLTQAEWTYILNTRTNASSKYGLATANSVNGLVLLPDSWTLPDGCSFTAGTASGYSANTYTAAQWTLMEANGAVFLPILGYIDNSSRVVSYVGSYGIYWASTASSTTQAYSFRANDVQVVNGFVRSYGFAVRLVQDL